MSFFERIKSQVDDPRYRDRGGSRQKVLIDRHDLSELLDHFERLDSEARALHPCDRLNVQLAYAIEGVFHQNGKDGESTLLLIMEVLKPLIEERRKQKLIQQKF